MPKIQLPKWTTKSTANKRRSQSTWNRFNTNTKTMFAKTKATLMPWAENSSSRRKNSNSNAARIARRSERRSSSSPNLFASWFKPKPKREEIRTVNDYLAQPRPSPGR